jgi:type IV secretion system protein VirB9
MVPEPMVPGREPAVPELVVVERPVYVPAAEAAKAKAPVTVAQGVALTKESNERGILAPEEYSKGAIVYDYHPDWVYEIYTQPLRLTDIRLEPGEAVSDQPFVSDSARWMLGASTSVEGGVSVQHVYVKPTESSLEASLIINTDRRSYHIVLRSFTYVYAPIVRWRYPMNALPQKYISAETPKATARESDELSLLDPRFLSFNYKITWGWFKKPVWRPSLAWDDGKKTYIMFPDEALRREMPAVFDNRSDVVNYRVLDNVMVIDKLIEKITVKLDGKQVVVEKKKG